MKQQFTVDDASAIMTWKGRRYRLPKGDPAFDKPFAWGWPRCIREVQSERYLVNVHGTFYEMPRDTGVRCGVKVSGTAQPSAARVS